jgi:hypothetical protein
MLRGHDSRPGGGSALAMLKPCVICKRPGRFRVLHFPDGEHATHSATICSLACLGVWIWRYGIHLSKQAARKLIAGGLSKPPG